MRSNPSDSAETASLSIPIKLLNDEAGIPAYAHDGDAGVDLRSLIDVDMAPFERICIPTGIALAIPSGHAGFVLPRSGLATKHGIAVANAPGLIDSNYRGEIKVTLINLDAHRPFHIAKGDRIAQLVIMRVENVAFRDTEELDESNRGSGGFGSSGIA